MFENFQKKVVDGKELHHSMLAMLETVLRGNDDPLKIEAIKLLSTLEYSIPDALKVLLNGLTLSTNQFREEYLTELKDLVDERPSLSLIEILTAYKKQCKRS